MTFRSSLSVAVSFAIGIAMGGFIMARSRKESSSNDASQEQQDNDDNNAETAPWFQSPMTKARRLAPLATVKKSRNKDESTSTSSSPMTAARNQESPGGLVPRKLVQDNTSSSVLSKQVAATAPPPQVRLVLQRFGHASFLVNQEMVHVGSNNNNTDNNHIGLAVYVSFGKSATTATNTEAIMAKAAKYVLQMPLLTRGVWGDNAKTESILQLALDTTVSVSLLIVPQANLICKVKSGGKSIQYHNQVDKTRAKRMYHEFCKQLKLEAWQQQHGKQQVVVPIKSNHASSSSSVDPTKMFHDSNLYASWDDAGIPLTTLNQEPLTKSARKKLQKMQASQAKRHEQHNKKSNKPTTTTQKQEEDHVVIMEPDESFVRIVSGTFGTLQALEMESNMGPFCHVVDL